MVLPVKIKRERGKEENAFLIIRISKLRFVRVGVWLIQTSHLTIFWIFLIQS